MLSHEHYLYCDGVGLYMEHLNEYRHRHTLGMTLDTVREVAIGVPTKGLDYLHEHTVSRTHGYQTRKHFDFPETFLLRNSIALILRFVTLVSV